MADERETTAQRDARVEAAEQDRADRAEKSPLTGVRTIHDVLRHLVRYGASSSPAHVAELDAVINDQDPDYQDPDAATASDRPTDADTRPADAKPANGSKGATQ